MPRPKMYRTQEQRRLANCAKSKRYYQKNAEDINIRKREKRLQESKEAETQAVIDRKKRRKNRGQEKCLLILDLNTINTRFLKLAQASPVLFLDQLYVDYQAWLLRPDSQSPLDVARLPLDELLTDIEKCAEHVLNSYGCGKEYAETTRIRAALREFILCIDDLELAYLENNLTTYYTQQRLRFQNNAVLHRMST
ncbi:hypothetical protein K435DRAFT_854023 [Dendrothele bispora CBS 962.96]|uniref:Uncharacterized protein n=1 Tax=Dendrothele bispora (strain CBS 962.96) TaxID=1314807 RepID=A0A4V4HH31_DENBC|nr:hypothetical protein K435DRAFT_854023 [Dendrothele bispora CBS 962.96]